MGRFDAASQSRQHDIHYREKIMAKEKTLDDLFYDTLKDIYYAERKILKALPKMARAASSTGTTASVDSSKPFLTRSSA